MERQIWDVGGREEKGKREEKRRVNRAFYMCEARERLLPIGVNSDFFVSVLPDQQANQTCVISPDEVSVND